MILYYIFTGDKPWGNEMSVSEIEKRVLNGERPIIPGNFDADIINTLITKSWDRDHAFRPSFNEIITILK